VEAGVSFDGLGERLPGAGAPDPAARQQVPQLARELVLPLVVRLEGTRVKEGKELLEQSGLPITTGSSLRDAAQKIVELAP
jgi:succinyl-CoA synthetase beta subunit